jgi:hypothetical protein
MKQECSSITLHNERLCEETGATSFLVEMPHEFLGFFEEQADCYSGDIPQIGCDAKSCIYVTMGEAFVSVPLNLTTPLPHPIE